MLRATLLSIFFVSALTLPAVGQEQAPARGRVPSNPAPNLSNKESQQPKGRVPGVGQTQNSSDRGSPTQGGLEIILKNGSLPSEPTEIAGIALAIDKIAPDLRFAQNLITRTKQFLTANELERPQILERSRRQLVQLDTKGAYWIAGKLTLGQYDIQKKEFSILSWIFDRREDGTFARNLPTNQSIFQSLPMSEPEARFLLSEMPSNRELNVLVQAQISSASTYDGNAGDLSVTIFFDTLQEVIWIPSRSKRGSPMIVASGRPISNGVTEVVSKPRFEQMNEPLVLDHESIAILLFRHQPDAITDKILVQMVMNRWIIERRRPKHKLITNQWPAFFSLQQALPNAGEIIRLVPSFRRWVVNRSKEIGDKVLVRLVTGSSTDDDCTAFGRVADALSLDRYKIAVMDGLLSEEDQQEITNDINNQSTHMKPRQFYKVGPMFFAMPAQIEISRDFPIERYIQDRCLDYPGGRGSPWLDINKNFPAHLKPFLYPVGVIKIAEWVKTSKHQTNFLVQAVVKSVENIPVSNGRPRLVLTLTPEKYETYEFSAGEQDTEPTEFASKDDIAGAPFLTDRIRQ